MQVLKVKLLLGVCVSLAATESCNRHTCDVCPPFWVPFQESCYRIFGTKLSWKAAEESCNKLFSGVAIGHLVSIRSDAENRFVSQLWDSSTGGMTDSNNRTYWIGLTDEENEGRWVWTDGNDEAVYTNWRQTTNEPNGRTNENCALVWNRDGNTLTWNDSKCEPTRVLFYVCELPKLNC